MDNICKIILPKSVHLWDVVESIGVLTGKNPIEPNPDTEEWRFLVEGVTVTPALYEKNVVLIAVAPHQSEVLTQAGIGLGDGADVLFHLDTRIMEPAATTYWLAIGMALVSVYSGYVGVGGVPLISICEPIKHYELKPLTVKDFDQARIYAVYK